MDEPLAAGNPVKAIASTNTQMTDIEARVCELLQSELFARNVQVVDIQMITETFPFKRFHMSCRNS